MAKRPGVELNVPINGNEAFSFQKNSCETVGFFRSWKFKSGEELKADIKVTDPENPNSQIDVVAVLSSDNPNDPNDPAAFWVGGPTDAWEFKGFVSDENAAKLNQAINATNSDTSQEVAPCVIKHDDKNDVFFKALDAEAPLKMVFTPDELNKVNEKPNPDIPEPRNYRFRVSLTPQGKAGKQQVNVAKSSELKKVKQVGGAATAAG